MTSSPSVSPADVRRVFLIDDHPLMRAGMAKFVGMEADLELCGELGRGRGALDAVVRACPHVILLDLSLPDSSGLELIKDFRAAGVDAAILVVSMHDELLYAERVLRAGADGYLMKEEAPDRVIEGIRTVLAGEVFLSDQMKRRLLNRAAGRARPSQEGVLLERLTDREFEIFELFGRGMSPRAIAKSLGIATKTVDAHRANIREKLGFADATALLRHAVRWVESGSRRAGPAGSDE